MLIIGRGGKVSGLVRREINLLEHGLQNPSLAIADETIVRVQIADGRLFNSGTQFDNGRLYATGMIEPCLGKGSGFVHMQVFKLMQMQTADLRGFANMRMHQRRCKLQQHQYQN